MNRKNQPPLIPGAMVGGNAMPVDVPLAAKLKAELSLVRALLERAIAQNGTLRLYPGDLDSVKRPGVSHKVKSEHAIVSISAEGAIAITPVPAEAKSERHALAEVLRQVAFALEEMDPPVATALRRAATILHPDPKAAGGDGPALELVKS